MNNYILSDTLIILAAGRGLRMGEITNSKPKPLLRFHDRHLIDYPLSQAKLLGIKHVYIVVGYKGELIEAYMKLSRWDFKVHIVYQRNYLSGTSDALKCTLNMNPELRKKEYIYVVASDYVYYGNPLLELGMVSDSQQKYFKVLCRLTNSCEANRSNVIIESSQCSNILHIFEKPQLDSGMLSNQNLSAYLIYLMPGKFLNCCIGQKQLSPERSFVSLINNYLHVEKLSLDTQITQTIYSPTASDCH